MWQLQNRNQPQRMRDGKVGYGSLSQTTRTMVHVRKYEKERERERDSACGCGTKKQGLQVNSSFVPCCLVRVLQSRVCRTWSKRTDNGTEREVCFPIDVVLHATTSLHGPTSNERNKVGGDVVQPHQWRSPSCGQQQQQKKKNLTPAKEGRRQSLGLGPCFHC